jgi:peptide deformylase
MTPTILDVLVWPDDRLHQECETVEEFNTDDLDRLAANMVATMDHRLGIGLAAPQVGLLIKMIVMFTSFNDKEDAINPITMINPVISWASEELFEWDEGCLSVPGYYEFRKRPKSVVVEYIDTTGEYQKIELVDLWAFVVQHEIEHLDGHLFIDELSPFKKTRIQKKITKTQKRNR